VLASWRQLRQRPYQHTHCLTAHACCRLLLLLFVRLACCCCLGWQGRDQQCCQLWLQALQLLLYV
jgi:hypothetical protein